MELQVYLYILCFCPHYIFYNTSSLWKLITASKQEMRKDIRQHRALIRVLDVFISLLHFQHIKHRLCWAIKLLWIWYFSLYWLNVTIPVRTWQHWNSLNIMWSFMEGTDKYSLIFSNHFYPGQGSGAVGVLGVRRENTLDGTPIHFRAIVHT